MGIIILTLQRMPLKPRYVKCNFSSHTVSKWQRKIQTQLQATLESTLLIINISPVQAPKKGKEIMI